MADITTAGPGLAGRDRVRAQSDAGASYRTFPIRLPAVLTALAGAFVVLGSLGASIRASAITQLHQDPQTVRVLMGASQSTGWAVAGFGAVLSLSALAWLGRRRLPKLAPIALTIVTASLVAGRLISFNDRAASWADAARRNPDFLGFHAGLGWGAWCALLGAIIAAFAVLIGLLREIDLRKGLAG